ncbi:MAG: hypothetical protein K0Q87_4010, partial [Neobacillus sp.]|nr:hypothetical protein [Neobacillus sp.]
MRGMIILNKFLKGIIVPALFVGGITATSLFTSGEQAHAATVSYYSPGFVYGVYVGSSSTKFNLDGTAHFHIDEQRAVYSGDPTGVTYQIRDYHKVGDDDILASNTLLDGNGDGVVKDNTERLDGPTG